MEFTFHLSEEKAREAFAGNVTVEEWLELFEEHSRSYGSYKTDLKIAEFFVKRLKEEYIDKDMYDKVPDVLKPLVVEAIVNDIKVNNERNKAVNIADKAKLEAIKTLRNYSIITYNDAIQLFCDGYDFAFSEKEKPSLEELSTLDLINELKRRTTE